MDQRWGVPASPRVVAPGEPVPKGGGIYKVGQPYQVDGQWQLHREIWNADTPAPAVPATDAATDEPA